MSGSDIAHEIGHWLTATPEQRRTPNYGCGPAVEDGVHVSLKDLDPRLSKAEAFQVERKASATGILLERELNLDWEETFYAHNWKTDDFMLVCVELFLAGRMDAAGRVIV